MGIIIENKALSFKLKMKGVERPVASRENVLPINTPSSKKHVVAKFESSMKVRTTQLTTIKYPKAFIKSGLARRIRPLGEVLVFQLLEDCA